MVTKVYEVSDDGEQKLKATYVNELSVRTNIISYLHQFVFTKSYKFWEYKDIPGVRKTRHGAYTFNLPGKTIIARAKQ